LIPLHSFFMLLFSQMHRGSSGEGAPATAEVVPNGLWPLDFGLALGEPVTRRIATKLPWLSGADNPAATALGAAGLPGVEAIDAKEAFTRQ
jgi:hypothetical protein